MKALIEALLRLAAALEDANALEREKRAPRLTSPTPIKPSDDDRKAVDRVLKRYGVG